MNYIVRAEYYPNGEVVPLGITDHNGNTLYLKEMEMSRSPDSYNKIGATFSVYCSHGKELQNNDSGESAFTVINFDSVFQNYDIIDFKWNGEIYDRCAEEVKNQYHKNIAAKNNVLTPNENIMQQVYDIGIVINHFAKENVRIIFYRLRTLIVLVLNKAV